MFFDKEVMFFNKEFDTQYDAIAFLANALMEKGLGKENYLEGVVEREKVFPTGLNVGGLGIAIPHTDGDRVNASQVAFMSLTKPVKFKEMCDLNKEVEVSVIFMLCLKEPHEQLEMLQTLVSLFQNTEVMSRVIEAGDVETLKQILKENGLE